MSVGLRALVLGAVALGWHPGVAASQETDVRDAVLRTFAAIRDGRTEELLREYAPGARIIVVGSGVIELTPTELARRLGATEWKATSISTQLIGGRSVTVAEMDGPLRIEGAVELPGPWRYAETRVRQGSEWRILQAEISPPDAAAAAGPSGGVAPTGRAGATPTGERRPGTGTATSAAAVTPAEGDASGTGAGGAAGGVADRQGTLAPDVEILGPPPPVPPAVIARDEQGNTTVRAIRLDAPLDIDGRLDEPVYSQVSPLDEFIQSLPDEGAPASELTEAWVMFDDENVFVSARVHDRAPESQWVANEMRRDLIRTNDNFGLIFDTYYDRRNGYFFYVNPLGAFSDIQVTNEGSPNFDWNPVWDVRTGRFEGGWTVEMRFPFKSLRYRPGTSQVWGLQLRRMIRRRNETAQLTLRWATTRFCDSRAPRRSSGSRRHRRGSTST